MTDGDPRKKLAYDESIRALQQQSSALDDLRSRTGILLAALALTASFLGAKALESSGFSAWSWAALFCFASAGGLSLLVLWPTGEWNFIFNADVILEDVGSDESLDDMREGYAKVNQENWCRNDKKLGCLYRRFRLAVVVLVLQVGFWLIALGTASHASTEKAQQTPVGTAQRGGTTIP